MKFLIIMLLTLFTAQVFAKDYAVIVNPANDDTNAKDAYLLDASWSSGESVQPLFLDKSGGLANLITHKAFATKFLGKSSISDFKAHYESKKAAGITITPIGLKDASAMKKYVSRKVGAIGYIPVDMVDGTVKQVGTFSN